MVQKRGALPAATFGISSLGAADSVLQGLRRGVARLAFSDSKLRSAGLAFLLHGPRRLDPALEVHRAPIMAWAKTVWEGAMTLADMNSAVDWAAARANHSRRPWLTVVSPAGALVLTLRRIGWAVLSAVEWLDDRRRLVRLNEVCPRSLLKLVDAAVVRWTWRTLANDHPEMELLDNGADLGSLQKLLGIKGSCQAQQPSDWGCLHAACLEATVTGAALPEDALSDRAG